MRAVHKIRPLLLRNRAPTSSHDTILNVLSTENIKITFQSVSTNPHVISQQQFHSSSRNDSTLKDASSTGKRIRRRRGRKSQAQPTSNENDDNGDKSNEGGPSSNGGKNGTSIHTFLSEVRNFLARTEKALEPMKRANEVFVIKRGSNEQGENLTLRLKPGEGNYVFQVDEEMLTLTLMSPMSGTYTYVLCPKTKSFIGMDDGHIAEGMFTRDLIRHCAGVPQF